MARDLFEEAGITLEGNGRDLFQEEGVEVSMPQQPEQKKSRGLQDFFQKALVNQMLGMLSQTGQQAVAPITPEFAKPFVKGMTDQIPRTAISSGNAIAQLLGKEGIELPEQEPSQSKGETAGRLLGEGATYGLAAAPLVAGGEALIPGLVGAGLGAGAAGGLLTEGGAKERGTSALVSSLLPTLGKLVGTGAKLGSSAFKKVSPRIAADVIQDTHDAQKELATSLFDKVYKGVADRKIGNIKLDKETKKIFPEIRKLGYTTDTFKQNLVKAQKGDFEALRTLQSDMRTLGEDYAKSKITSEKIASKRVNELRDKINSTIQKDLKAKGHEDLASDLQEARKQYKDLYDTYYKKSPVANLVGEDRYVPDSLLKTLSRDSKFYKELRAKHPELDKLLETFSNKQSLKKLGVTATGQSTGLAALKYLLGGGSEKEPYVVQSGE